MLTAIVLGVALTNLRPLPASCDAGVAFAGKRILRVGVVLLGLQLSLATIATLGAGMIAVVVAVVAGGIAASLALGRILRVPPVQGLLIACGFSICGAAVAAVDGVVDAPEQDSATAIALVVLFGTLSIPVMPFVGSVLGFDLYGRSVFVGASIHEVAQVVAAAGLVDPNALAPAILVKLARVSCSRPSWRRSPSGAGEPLERSGRRGPRSCRCS